MTLLYEHLILIFLNLNDAAYNLHGFFVKVYPQNKFLAAEILSQIKIFERHYQITF